MSDLTCPWCETALELSAELPVEQTCPECLTSWSYEDEEIEYALAA